jgi:hypothetical protein
LRRHRFQAGWFFVADDRLCGSLVALRTFALNGRVRMDGKSRRVNSDFDKLANPHMAFHRLMRDLETVALLGMHPHTVDELISIGQLSGTLFGHDVNCKQKTTFMLAGA